MPRQPEQPLSFEQWLALKGWDRATLHSRELAYLQACWVEECRTVALRTTITAPAPSVIRAAARGAGPEPSEFRILSSGPCSIVAAEGENKLPTFSMVAYTGAPMRPAGWWNDVIVDLEGVKIPSQHRPILRQHDHEKIVGHSTEVKVSAKGIEASGVLSGHESPHAQEIVRLAKNGFQWQASIGADPIRTEFLEAGEETEVNGRTVTGPMTISRETKIGEISFVPLGADGDTSATVTASRGRTTVYKAQLKHFMAALRAAGRLKAARYSDEDVDQMSEDDAKAALKRCMADDDQETESEDDSEEEMEEEEEAEAEEGGEEEERSESSADQRIKARRKKAAAELRRVDAVQAACRRHGVSECEVTHGGRRVRVNLAAHAIEHGWSAQRTELAALRAARPGPGVGLPGGLGYSTSTPEATPEVLECAILQAGRHQFRLDDDAFYRDEETGARRVPEYKQREVQTELRARYNERVQQAAHTLFRGRAGLQSVMVAAARANGYRGSDRIGDGNLEEVLRFGQNNAGAWGTIRAESSSTMSIANILANVQNKFALAGYLFVEQAWREIASIRPTNDFKPTKSVNLLADSEAKLVPDNGELDDAYLTDQAFANQADQYGRMLTIGRKSIINDDLSILTTAPMQMGLGAGRALNKLFWVVFGNLRNVNGDDGNTFFSAGRTTAPAGQVVANDNYMSGGSSALSSAALQTAKQMFDNQIDPMGYPLGFDNPPVLLFPPELWQTAIELVDPSAIGIVYGGASASRQPNINLWKGRLKPVMSRYLNKTLTTFIPNIGNTSPTTVTGSTTAWYVLYPAVAGVNVIEVAFLGGVDTPTVQTAGPDWNFNRLGISMRVLFDFGVNQQNFRAGIKSAGA